MFRKLFASMIVFCLALGVLSHAEARTTPAAKGDQFTYSGKLPHLVKVSFDLDKILTKKQRKKLAAAGFQTKDPSSCGKSSCDVVIIDDGVPPGLRIVGLMLNIFLPLAIGSWVAGDRLGAYFGTTAQLGGLGLFILGYALTWGGGLLTVGYTLAIVGATLMLAGWVLPMITVMLFRRSIYRRHHYRRRYYRRRYYRRRYRRRYSSPSHIHSGSMAKAFATTSEVKAAGFSF